MAYAKTTLTGTYQHFDGTPAEGFVEIIPSERVVKDTEGNVILSGRVKVTLDAAGSFSVDLPATDDPGLNPTGFGYTLAAKLRHHHPPAVSFSLPAGAPVDVEDVTSVDPSTFTPDANYVQTGELATVATSGSYTDLADQPAIPATAADVGAEPAGLSADTNAGLAAAYAPRVGRSLPHIEAMPWYAYGHSYLASDSRNTPGARYIQRLEKIHAPTSLANRAVGGHYMQNAATDAVGTGAGEWLEGSTGLVIIDATANDLIWAGTSAVQRSGYEHGLRTLCALLSAGQRIEETDAGWTYTGDWTAIGANANLSGGDARLSPATAPDEAASITFTGTEASLLTTLFASTSGHDVGELVIDGNVVGSLDTGGQLNAGSIDYMPGVVRVTGLTEGSHTLTWRRANTRAGNIWLDALLLPSDTPPTIVLVKQPYMTAAGYAAGGHQDSGDATADLYRAIMDGVAAEFPNVIVADPNEGWDRTTMWGGDGYHPNDRGHAHIAAAIEDALTTITWRDGLNMLTA